MDSPTINDSSYLDTASDDNNHNNNDKDVFSLGDVVIDDVAHLPSTDAAPDNDDNINDAALDDAGHDDADDKDFARDDDKIKHDTLDKAVCNDAACRTQQCHPLKTSHSKKDILNNKSSCPSTSSSLIIVSNLKQSAHSKTQQNK